MRGPRTWAVAVRTPEDEIELVVHDAPTWAERWAKVPVLRGVMALGESMSLGFKALRSEEQQLAEHFARRDVAEARLATAFREPIDAGQARLHQIDRSRLGARRKDHFAAQVAACVRAAFELREFVLAQLGEPVDLPQG
jgi:hypothetical protein